MSIRAATIHLCIARAQSSRLYPTGLRHLRRHLNTQGHRFTEGERVLLRHADDPDKPPILSKPLKPGGKIESHRGVFEHTDIIGKQPRDVVISNNGKDARMFRPTLAEYVTLTRRLVTPVYPSDANLIVSLLDIHVSPNTQSAISQDRPLELLEAGTGHGALTLHLARAIHAANAPRPSDHFDKRAVDTEGDAHDDSSETAHVEDLAVWKSRRQAILYTLDISAANSAYAEKIVSGFRNGVYAGNVDFHVGDVSDFLVEQMKSRGSDDPFLSHVVLDLPGPHQHLERVAQAVLDDGSVLVFNPSVTQIVECVQLVRSLHLPLVLEQVVQLEANAIGGKQWDVRMVRPRALSRSTALNERIEAQVKGNTSPEDEVWHVVCRPKVGDRLVGGGFLGLWRRMKTDLSVQPAPKSDIASTEAGP